MKKLFKAASGSQGKYFSMHQSTLCITRYAAYLFGSLILIGFLFSGCKKQDMNIPKHDAQVTSNKVFNTDEEFRKKYDRHTRIGWRTLWELLQARVATARYRNINKAIEDGYADISVVVPNMGHHYMKKSIVDGTFDITKPEILVYNKDHDGKLQLVAAEYAVPIPITPNAAPAGFSGDDDVWDRNIGFDLYLLHTWVWHFNPDGVFNPTNPLVHLH